ncbi:MAG: prenyltransferase/squalene oxidase repeat-containing protein [Fimbriiglobus sp.]
MRSKLNPDGGFQDRAGNSDLYYTVFGLEGLRALRVDVPYTQVRDYLLTYADGPNLDFVHLGCLARCWANLPDPLRAQAPAQEILRRIEAHRSADGGYAAEVDAKEGTAYACFVALGAYQDMNQELIQPEGMIHCVERLRAEDGGYANQADVLMGLTPSTAAAITILRQLGKPVPTSLGEWLLSRCHPAGGFYATPMAPLPDLLSTATALHALSSMHTSYEKVRESCLDYIDTLWTNRGGFHGNWTDDDLDCEYTYYGLLALGHLSV